MTFTYSTKRSLRRQQKAFIEAALAQLPEHIQTLIRGLDCKVVFKALDGYRGKCIYYQSTIYLPSNYWKDQAFIAKWMRQENQAFFIHECFHAVDILHLTPEQRHSLLFPLTGFPANAGGTYPTHVDANGVQQAQWFHDDFAQSAAELFADTGVEAFTSHQFTRAPTALQVTEEGKAAVKEMLA